MEDGVADIFQRIEAFRDGSPADDDQLLLGLGFLDEEGRRPTA
jgi:hypothetical protein